MSGGVRGRFDGGQLRENTIRMRVNEALAGLPPAERRRCFDAEYKRQTAIYNQTRDAKKRAKKERYEQRMRAQEDARNQKAAAKASAKDESELHLLSEDSERKEL